LEGSLGNLKFLEVLFLNDNKLRNLDKNLELLKHLTSLKNLCLFGNPLAEEPEYRSRVVCAIPSLEIFDRHGNIYN
jgi:Leucine-rich repeat (LRR) protein